MARRNLNFIKDTGCSITEEMMQSFNELEKTEQKEIAVINYLLKTFNDRIS